MTPQTPKKQNKIIAFIDSKNGYRLIIFLILAGFSLWYILSGSDKAPDPERERLLKENDSLRVANGIYSGYVNSVRPALDSLRKQYSLRQTQKTIIYERLQNDLRTYADTATINGMQSFYDQRYNSEPGNP